MSDRMPRLFVLDRRSADDALGDEDDLAASTRLVMQLDRLADAIAPRGTVAMAVATTIRDGGLVCGAWSEASAIRAVRRRTGGPVLRVPPGALHLAVWSPDRDTWLATPPDRVANRNARAFARALRATTGGRELLVRDGGVVGSFGWAWGPTRGLTLEVFVASDAPLTFVDTAVRAPDGARLRPLAAGLPMHPFGTGASTAGDVLGRLVRELAPRVSEVVALPDGAFARELDASNVDPTSATGEGPRAPVFVAPPRLVPMGSATCWVSGGGEGLSAVGLAGEVFKPDDLDARWTAALRGRWPDPDEVAATLARVEDEAAVRAEGTPPLEELAASLSMAISLARDHAR